MADGYLTRRHEYPHTYVSEIAQVRRHAWGQAVSGRVLVVDDEENIQKFVAFVLRDAGYRAETAANGREALETFDHGATFDVIISDVRMPSMSGPRFVEQLRQTEPDVKVLFLTGYSKQLLAEHGELWIDEALLEKPCTAQELLDCVSKLACA